MLELFLALKYLAISRRNVSSGLIALASTLVIALVVSLLLTFFSVTANMEKRWIEKITALSAPLRITPTENYYNSYYYQADSAAESSNFTLKSLGEKMRASSIDPINLQVDETSSLTHLPKALDDKGGLRHLAKELERIVSEEDVTSREFNVTGGGMRFRLVRDVGRERMQSFISAVPYFFGVDRNEPKLGELLIEPTVEDFDNLIKSALSSSEPALNDQPDHEARAPKNLSEKRLSRIVGDLDIKALKTGALPWRIPSNLLPQSGETTGWRVGKSSPIYLQKPEGKEAKPVSITFGEKDLKIDGKRTYLKSSSPLMLEAQATFDTQVKGISGENWLLSFKIGGLIYSGEAPISALHIAVAHPSPKPALWATADEKGLHMPSQAIGTPILLPKNFKEKGCLLGDLGYLSYQDVGLSGASEQRLSAMIAGFYDPGLSPLASRIVLLPREAALTIAASTSQYDFDQTLGNGLLIWGKEISATDRLKMSLDEKLKAADLDPFFKVTTYTDYEFTRPFLKQFQSDKQLFTLISGMILLVACCNIFSFLILLVNDKRSDIAILSAMGASKKRITRIFSLCALAIGIAATVIGTLTAAIFLQQLPRMLSFLSFLQNHPAFSPDLFGVSGSVYLDPTALAATWVGVPLLSLLAGLVAARKAASINPTQVLKS